MKIDIVVPMVDPSDSNYWSKNSRFLGKRLDKERYRSWNNFHYFFRSVEKNAPWVNKIFLITDNQIPKWLNINHPLLEVVDHTDYIPLKYLPTFNSNVIEMNLHRIKELSEFFVLFNDDHFILNSTSEEDFFEDGKAKCEISLDIGIGKYSKMISHIELNNILYLNEKFNKKDMISNFRKELFLSGDAKQLIKSAILYPWNSFTGFYNSHLPVSLFKSTVNYVWNDVESVLDPIFEGNRFRTKNDLNQWLIKYWQIIEGRTKNRSFNFGKSFDLTDSNVDEVIKEVESKQYKIVCFNDNEKIKKFEITQTKLNEYLEKKFPEKSSFEL